MGGGGCGYGAPTTKAGNGAIPDMPHESTFPPRDCGGARLYPSLAAFGKEGGSGITPLKNDGAGGSGGTVAAGRRASEALWKKGGGGGMVYNFYMNLNLKFEMNGNKDTEGGEMKYNFYMNFTSTLLIK